MNDKERNRELLNFNNSQQNDNKIIDPLIYKIEATSDEEWDDISNAIEKVEKSFKS